MINRAEIEEVMGMEGKVLGAAFQTDASYVKIHWGDEGLSRVEKRLSELGHPFDYGKAHAMDWIPIGQRILSLLVIKDIFNLGDEDIKTMGDTAPKMSFFIKLVMRFFSSPRLITDHTPELWARHYDRGKLEVDFHEKEGYSILTLKDIKLHPILCKYLEGYFKRVMQFVVGRDTTCEETGCVHKGDPAHVFKLIWG